MGGPAGTAGRQGLSNPLLEPSQETTSTSATAEEEAQQKTSWIRRQCADPFRRACWIVSSISVAINVVASVIITYYLVVFNPGNTPVVPPPVDAKCSVSEEVPLQVLQENATSALICWTGINQTNGGLKAPYVLKLSDWFAYTSEYIAYAGVNTSVMLYNIVPQMPFNVTLERYTELGEPPSVFTLITQLNTTGGGCSSMSDLHFFQDHRETAKLMIQHCLEGSVGLPKLAIPCMVGHGMSENCSECWYREGLCTITKCFTPCAHDAAGAACASCSERECFPKCVECAQIPRRVFPP